VSKGVKGGAALFGSPRDDNSSCRGPVRHLRGIRKKWRTRSSDELCKQVKTPS